MTRIQRDYPQAESVHRLDMATSGVIVVALTKAAERELKRQFREREPKNSMWPASGGIHSPAEGLVDLPLICDWPNRPKQKSVTKQVNLRRRSMKWWNMRRITRQEWC